MIVIPTTPSRLTFVISKLTSMHEMMLLEVCELCEAFGANVALEGPLAGVRPQVHLEIR